MRRRGTISRDAWNRPGYYADRAADRKLRQKKADPFYENRGWFKRGYDPRRHIFTREECQAGYMALVFALQYYYPKIRDGKTARKIANHIISARNCQKQVEF